MNVGEYTLVDCIDLVKHENDNIDSALRRLHMDMSPTSETKEIQKSTKADQRAGGPDGGADR